MATTPTNSPIPSEKPQDLKFNAGKIDEEVNSSSDYYVDRFGVSRLTNAGRSRMATEAISQFGYITLDSFEDGASLSIPNQVLRYQSTGEYYRWDGPLPKIVTANSTPESSGGIGIGKWLSVGDATLRSEIFNNFIDWVTPDSFRLALEVDDTASFVRALSASKNIKLLGREYLINSDIVMTEVDDVYFIGEGSSKTKIKANTSGDFLFKLHGPDNDPAPVRNRISLQGLTLDGNNLSRDVLITCAAQSPMLTNDVYITGGIRHGFVHTRGWSTFSYGLVCNGNGGDGIRLEADNNNTHWEGMWGHNGGRGIFVQNADAVTFMGSAENNGQEGIVITASTSISPPLENTVTSLVCTDSLYLEGNGRSASGTFAEIRIGGGSGLVRDLCIRNTHISCTSNGIGIDFGKNISNIIFDTVAVYQVQAPTNAHVRFSSDYLSLGAIASTGLRFVNFNCLDNINVQGFSDPNLDTQAFIRGGGTTGTSRDKRFEYIMLSGGNLLGEYRQRFLRGNDIIGEIGIIPNSEMFLNAYDSEGVLTFKTTSQERMRFGKQGFLKANHLANYNGPTALQHELSGSSPNQSIVTISNQSTTNPNGLNINFNNSDPNNTTQNLISANAQGNQKFTVFSNGNAVNQNNSYGGISDGNLKERVTDASSAWDDLKKYHFVNYYLKSDKNQTKLLGVISQEIKEVSPGLVSSSPVMMQTTIQDDEGNEDSILIPTGETVESVNYSVIYLKTSIALQEAIIRIENIEKKLKEQKI